MKASECFPSNRASGVVSGSRRPHYCGASGTNRPGRRRAQRSRALTAVVIAILGVALLASSGTAHAFTERQAKSGARIFKQQCARCHGEKLEGKDNSFRGLRAPKLVGAGALPCKPRPYQKLRHNDFKTVKDVYEFVSATMPADQPAALSSSQYWDALAFVLEKNGKTADSTKLDAASSAKIVLHTTCTAGAGAQKAQP